jgi:predicted kinase
MIKVILTKGLPASGKSTWAKKILSENPNSYKRVNKDDVRMMLDDGKFSKANESFVLKVRDSIIMLAIENGKHVIVDDTNLAPKHEQHIRELVKGVAEVVIQDFTDVDVETCVKRDLQRSQSVGESVIRGMYNQFLKKTEQYNEDKNLPWAIIVDIDGTLAKMNGRGPFDWDRVGEDLCNDVIKNIVHNYSGDVILMSGRDSICRTETINWLYDNGIFYNELFMREHGNFEKDTIIKRRMFEENVRGKYYIEYVLDD